MYAFSKFMAGYWDVKNTICYASGLTAEQMGDWM